LSARLATIFRLRYLEADTTLQACAAAYLVDLTTLRKHILKRLKAKAAKRAAAAAEAAAAAAVASSGDAVAAGPAPAPADGGGDGDDADDDDDDDDDNYGVGVGLHSRSPSPGSLSPSESPQLTDYTPATALGKAVVDYLGSAAASRPPADAGDSGSSFPADMRVAGLSLALVDAYLTGAGYVMDAGWLTSDHHAAIAAALASVGADAQRCIPVLEDALVRLVVDAAAGREEPSTSVSSPRSAGDGGGGDGDEHGHGGHVRFAEGTKADPVVETRGGKGIPKVAPAADGDDAAAAAPAAGGAGAGDGGDGKAKAGSGEEDSVPYDAVAEALETARLRRKTTKRLWHARQQRAVIRCALTRLRLLARLSDAEVVAALLPQQVVELQLCEAEVAARTAAVPLNPNAGAIANADAAAATIAGFDLTAPPTEFAAYPAPLLADALPRHVAPLPSALAVTFATVQDPVPLSTATASVLAELAAKAAADGGDDAGDADKAADDAGAGNGAPGNGDGEASGDDGGSGASRAVRRVQVRRYKLARPATTSDLTLPLAPMRVPERRPEGDAVDDADAVPEEEAGDGEGAVDAAAPLPLEDMPAELSRGRLFLPISSTLPWAVVAAEVPTLLTPAPPPVDVAASSALAPAIVPPALARADPGRMAHGAAWRYVTVDGAESPDAVLTRVVHVLGGGAMPPFTGAPLVCAPLPPRRVPLPPEMMESAPIFAGGSQAGVLGDEAVTEWERGVVAYLLRDAVVGDEDVIRLVSAQVSATVTTTQPPPPPPPPRPPTPPPAPAVSPAADSGADAAPAPEPADSGRTTPPGPVVDEDGIIVDDARDEDAEVAAISGAPGDEGAEDADAASPTAAVVPADGVDAAASQPDAPPGDDGAGDGGGDGADAAGGGDGDAAPPPPPKVKLPPPVVTRTFTVEWTTVSYKRSNDPMHDWVAASDPTKLSADMQAHAYEWKAPLGSKSAGGGDGEEADDADAAGGDEGDGEAPPSALARMAEKVDGTVEATKDKWGEAAEPALKAACEAVGSEPHAKYASGEWRRWSPYGRCCPVSLVDEGRVVPGNLACCAVYRGFLFACADPWKLAQFCAYPAPYLARLPTLPPCRSVAIVGTAPDLQAGVAEAAASEFASQYGLPVVDARRVVAGLVADERAQANPDSVAAHAVAELRTGGTITSRTLARALALEVARLQAAAMHAGIPGASMAAPSAPTPTPPTTMEGLIAARRAAGPRRRATRRLMSAGSASVHTHTAGTPTWATWDAVNAAWFAVSHPDYATARTEVERIQAATAAEAEEAVAAVKAAAAKKKTPAKKVEEAVAAEQKKWDATLAERLAKAKAAEEARLAHEDDDEDATPEEAEDGTAGAGGADDGRGGGVTSAARAFDLLPRSRVFSGPGGRGAFVPGGQHDGGESIDEYSHRLRLHHVLDADGMQDVGKAVALRAYMKAMAGGSGHSGEATQPTAGVTVVDDGDGDTWAATAIETAAASGSRPSSATVAMLKDRFLCLVAGLTGVGLVDGRMTGGLPVGSPLPARPTADVCRTAWSSRLTHLPTAPHHLLDETSLPLAQQWTILAQRFARHGPTEPSSTATAPAAPWPVGLVGQDAWAVEPGMVAAYYGAKRDGTTASAASSPAPSVATGYVLVGVPPRIGLWRHLVKAGICPQQLLVLGNSGGGSGEGDGGDGGAEPGSAALPPLLSLPDHGDAARPRLGATAESGVAAWHGDERWHSAAAPTAASETVAGGIGKVLPLLRKFGVQVRNLPVPPPAESTAAASAKTLRDAVAAARQQVDPFLLQPDDATGEAADAAVVAAATASGEGALPSPLTGNLCPVALVDDGIPINVAGFDEATRVAVGGFLFACASPAAAAKFRAHTAHYVARVKAILAARCVDGALVAPPVFDDGGFHPQPPPLAPRICLFSPRGTRLDAAAVSVVAQQGGVLQDWRVVSFAAIKAATEKRLADARAAAAAAKAAARSAERAARRAAWEAAAAAAEARGEDPEPEPEDEAEDEAPDEGEVPPADDDIAVDVDAAIAAAAPAPVLLVCEGPSPSEAVLGKWAAGGHRNGRGWQPWMVIPVQCDVDEAAAYAVAHALPQSPPSAASGDGDGDGSEEADPDAVFRSGWEEDKAAAEAFTSALASKGVQVQQALPWSGIAALPRLAQRLVVALQALQATSPQALLAYLRGQVAPAPLTAIIAGVRNGSVSLSRFGAQCPIALADEGWAVPPPTIRLTHPASTALPRHPDDEAAGATEEGAGGGGGGDGEGEDGPPLPAGVQAAVPLLSGCRVLFASSTTTAAQILSRPGALLTLAPATPAHVLGAPVFAMVGFPDADAEDDVLADALPADTPLVTIIDTAAAVHFVRHAAKSALRDVVDAELASGGALSHEAVLDCAAALLRSSAARSGIAVIRSSLLRHSGDVARLAAAGVAPDVVIAAATATAPPPSGTEPKSTAAVGPVGVTTIAGTSVTVGEEALADGSAPPATLLGASALVAAGQPPSTVPGAWSVAAHQLERALPVWWVDPHNSQSTAALRAQVGDHLFRAWRSARALSLGVPASVAPWGLGSAPAPPLQPVGDVCALSWALRRQHIAAAPHVHGWQHSVAVKGRVYHAATPADAAALLARPFAPLHRAHLHTSPPQLPSPLQHWAPGSAAITAARAPAVACAVCSADAHIRRVPSLHLTAYGHRRAAFPHLTASWAGRTAAFCSLQHREVFARDAGTCMLSLPPAAVAPPPLPRVPPAAAAAGGSGDGETGAGELSAAVLHGLFASASAHSDFSGYLESALLPAVDRALQDLQVHRTGAPSSGSDAAGADVTTTAGALRFVAMHLRAHDAFAKPHLRARSKRMWEAWREGSDVDGLSATTLRRDSSASSAAGGSGVSSPLVERKGRG